MKDEKGKKNSQCIVFIIAIGIMTIAMIIASEVENYPECVYGDSVNVCRTFECTEENICSCDEEDFATDYAYGIIQHSRPYRCDPTDKDFPPYKIGNMIAFGTGILAIFVIGWITQYHNHKCDCEGECYGCGCKSASKCSCASDCPKCCAPSRYGMKTVCGCQGCKKKMKSGSVKANEFLCICKGCLGPVCLCGSKDGLGTQCEHPLTVVVEKSKKNE